MAGIRVTLLRVSGMGQPAMRMFDDATDWTFSDKYPGGTLHIMKQKAASAVASPGYANLTIIAEFPADGIESVEFV